MKKILFTSVAGALLFSANAIAQDNVCSKPADQMTLEEFGNCQFKHIDDSQSLHLNEGCVTNCMGEKVETGSITTIETPVQSEGASVVRNVETNVQKVQATPSLAVTAAPNVATITAPKVARMASAPAAPKVVRLSAARKSPVFFSRGSAELLTSSTQELNESAQAMKNNPSWFLNINGHASADGDDAFNMDLSSRRANAVYLALLERGVPASQLASQGFGETLLKNAERPESPENRRVEMVLEAR